MWEVAGPHRLQPNMQVAVDHEMVSPPFQARRPAYGFPINVVGMAACGGPPTALRPRLRRLPGGTISHLNILRPTPNLRHNEKAAQTKRLT
jgi:hypothetical protein